jgi:25S rRNA (uracil2634-N3)-methyltransferase
MKYRNSLNQGLEHIRYLGSMVFKIEDFPDYKIRNVDRDKHVKDTQGITYVWSPRTEEITKKKTVEERKQLTENLFAKTDQGQACCQMCKAGPFVSASDKALHEQSKKHQLMQQYENQYARALSAIQ